MKRKFFLFFFVVGCLVGMNAQNEALPYVVTSDHYRVLSMVSERHAAVTAEMMEAYYTFFNSFLHFPEDMLIENGEQLQMRIRLFANKGEFDTYIARYLNTPKDSFVHLQYDDRTQSELVAYVIDDEEEYQDMLIHYSAIQFFNAFIPSPPLWLQRGFAIYVDKSRYDPTIGEVKYKENLLWLATLQQLLANPAFTSSFPDRLSALLVYNTENANSNLTGFYAVSWGLFYFLLQNSDRYYNRILWDSLRLLRPQLNVYQNSGSVRDSVFGWVERGKFVNNYISFINSIRDFDRCIIDGRNYYANGEYGRAAEIFSRAVYLEPRQALPLYYLGLINYEQKEYESAYNYLINALVLQNSDEQTVTYYALAVVRYAQQNYQSARDFLNRAAVRNDPRYQDKIEALLERIEFADSNRENY